MSEEDRLIARIARALGSARGIAGGRGGVALGIGDDALLLRPCAGKQLAITVDSSIEDVHFWRDRHSPDSIGYKALTRATSDLAAMGAAPLFFLMSLAIPPIRGTGWLDRLLGGMARAAEQLGLVVAGGDTTKAKQASISLTVVGEVAAGRAITRAGARPGDHIFVSGTLGRAQLGFELIRRGKKLDRKLGGIVEAHLYGQARVELGAWLARHRAASAMIDLSDGLSSDLGRLCAASRVGAIIDPSKLPCVEARTIALTGLRGPRVDPLALALNGGEDYELLFAVPKKHLAALERAPGYGQLREIGRIQTGRRVLLLGANGAPSSLVAAGWDPFRSH